MSEPTQPLTTRTDRVWTAANILTFLRMGLIPVFATMLVYHREAWALLFFTIAGVSDGIDGFLARRLKQESELGTIIDPIADKLLLTTAFVMLTIPGMLSPGRHLPVPFWVTACVIGRDIAIVAVAGAINMMTGFRGFKPSWLGKASTFVQVSAVILILLAAANPQWNGSFLPTVYLVVAAFAIFSGFHYVYWVAKLIKEEQAGTGR